MLKLGWGHRTKYSDVCKAGMRGTPHIPIDGIWSDIQSRVGTPHKILRCLRSRGGESPLGTPHIPIEGIWSDIHSRVGTPHKILRCLRSRGGGHRTYHMYKEMQDRRVMAGWLDGWMVLCNYNATSWLHLASWNLQDSQLS